jgi:hypothetical protein
VQALLEAFFGKHGLDTEKTRGRVDYGAVEKLGTQRKTATFIYPLSFPRKREGGFTFEVQHFIPK